MPGVQRNVIFCGLLLIIVFSFLVIAAPVSAKVVTYGGNSTNRNNPGRNR